MKERMIGIEIKLTGIEEFVSGIDQITAGLDRMTSALQRVNEAMKEFNSLYTSEDIFAEFAKELHQETINRLEAYRSSPK